MLKTDISSNFLHFLGHAYHDYRDPKQSALELTAREKLSLDYILNQLDLSNYYLVCLSACETGVTSPTSPLNEYVGLASAFLAKGVSYIVSSLWKVDDVSSSFLMIEFYRLMSKKNPLHPVTALSDAQLWIRTVSRKDLSKWCQQQSSQLYEIAAKAKLSEQEKDQLVLSIEVLEDYSYIILDLDEDPPYRHSYYWAGFAITGLPPEVY